MKSAFLCLVLSISMVCANAQAPSLALNKFVQKVNSFKNVSYVSMTKNESPLGDNSDTILIHQNRDVNKKGLQFASQSRYLKEAYFDGSLLSINLIDKYYSVNKDYRYANIYSNSNPLFKLIDVIKNVPATSIKSMPDTIINKTACYHIKISKQDSLIRGNRTYDIYELYLSKFNLLPLYSENLIQGYIEKGGVSSKEVFNLINRNWYSKYKINQKDFPDITIIKAPAGFITVDQYNNKDDHKVLALLPVGEKAPDWRLEDLNGKFLSSDELKDKVVLIDFFGSYCAPCIFAIPIINKLHEKYKNSPVQIVSVNIDPDKGSALKFANKYKVAYPTYINGKSVADEFHVTPIPTFYLINKRGKVVTTIDGYNDDLEKVLTLQIDKLLK